VLDPSQGEQCGKEHVCWIQGKEHVCWIHRKEHVCWIHRKEHVCCISATMTWAAHVRQ